MKLTIIPAAFIRINRRLANKGLEWLDSEQRQLISKVWDSTATLAEIADCHAMLAEDLPNRCGIETADLYTITEDARAAQHTPGLPYLPLPALRVHATFRGHSCISDVKYGDHDSEEVIAVVSENGFLGHSPRADQIVRAVNSHAALVDALETALSLISYGNEAFAMHATVLISKAKGDTP